MYEVPQPFLQSLGNSPPYSNQSHPTFHRIWRFKRSKIGKIHFFQKMREFFCLKPTKKNTTTLLIFRKLCFLITNFRNSFREILSKFVISELQEMTFRVTLCLDLPKTLSTRIQEWVFDIYWNSNIIFLVSNKPVF